MCGFCDLAISPIFPPSLGGNVTAAWASFSFWSLRVSPAELAGRTLLGMLGLTEVAPFWIYLSMGALLTARSIPGAVGENGRHLAQPRSVVSRVVKGRSGEKILWYRTMSCRNKHKGVSSLAMGEASLSSAEISSDG